MTTERHPDPLGQDEYADKAAMHIDPEPPNVTTRPFTDAEAAALAAPPSEATRCPGCAHTCCPYPGLECGGDSDRVRECETSSGGEVTADELANLLTVWHAGSNARGVAASLLARYDVRRRA